MGHITWPGCTASVWNLVALTLKCVRDSTPNALQSGKWFSLLCLWKLETTLFAAICHADL